MHPFNIALGSIVKDSVQYVNFVKITIDSSTITRYILIGRTGIYLLTKELDLDFKTIAFEELKSIHLKGKDSILIRYSNELLKNVILSELIIITNDRDSLLKSLIASYKTTLLLSFKRFDLPLYREEAEKNGNETKEFAFKGAKKVEFYLSLIHGRIMNIKSESMSMKLQVYKPVFIGKKSLNDLTELSSSIIPIIEGFKKRQTRFYILNRGQFSKRMNLNDDIASWTGYFVYAKTERFDWIFYYLRRLYIPPLMDSYQDFIFEFSHEGFANNFASFINQTLLPPNSITSINQHILFKDVIQTNMDLMLYDYSFYIRASRLLSLKVSYQPLVNEFSSILIDLLSKGGEAFDISISAKLHNSGRRWNEIVSMIRYSVPGLSNQKIEGKEAALKRMRIFNKYLASHLARSINKGENFGVEVIARIIARGNNTNQKIEPILNYMSYMIDRRGAADHSINTLEKILEICNHSDLWNVKCQLQAEMSYLSINSYPFLCLLKSGYIRSKVASMENFIMMLSIILLVCDIDLKLVIISKFLQKYTTFDKTLLPLVSSITKLLQQDASRTLTIQLLIFATNCTYSNDEFKDEFIKEGIAQILPKILINHDSVVVGAALKLMINLTKKIEHINAFIPTGTCKVLVDMFDNLEYKNNLSDVSAIIGQICNCDVARISLFKGSPEKISNLLLEGNINSRIVFALYQLASCNFYNKYIIGNKIFKLIPRLLQSDDLHMSGNALRLLVELVQCPQFVFRDEMRLVMGIVERFKKDDRFTQLISDLNYAISISSAYTMSRS